MILVLVSPFLNHRSLIGFQLSGDFIWLKAFKILVIHHWLRDLETQKLIQRKGFE